MGHKDKIKMENKMLTKGGQETLLNYTRSLIKEWHKKDEKDYPVTFGIAYGIPYFKESAFDRTFDSKAELMARIKGFAQLLGMSVIEVELSSGILELDLKGDIT